MRINGVVTNPIEYITNGVIPSSPDKEEEKDEDLGESQNETKDENEIVESKKN